MEPWVGGRGRRSLADGIGMEPHHQCNASAGTVTMPFVGTPVSASTGTGSTASVSIAADDTNKCVALNFTPPTGNTDAWDVVAEVRTAEVQ